MKQQIWIEHKKSWGRALRLLTALVFIVFVTSTSNAQTQNARGDGPAGRAEGDAIWSVVGGLPFAAQGTGPVVYVLAYSTCPYTAAFFHDWGGDPAGVQVRWVFYPVDTPTKNSSAEVALTRDPAVVAGLINRTRTSPPGNSSQASIDAFNTSVTAYNHLNQVFASFHHEHVISPTFIWKMGDTVYVSRGYDRGFFTKVMLPSIRQATAAPQF